MDISKKLKRMARAEDFNTGRAVRISTIEEIEIGNSTKIVMWADGEETPIPLSNEALRQISAICDGSTETNDWTGRWVFAFNDRNVMVDGQKKGGIRFRKASDADIVAAEAIRQAETAYPPGLEQ